MGDVSFSIYRFFNEESPLITILKEIAEALKAIAEHQRTLCEKSKVA